MKAFPCSGEINFKVKDTFKVIETIKAEYLKDCVNENYIDGVSIEFEKWRVNVRNSNTERTNHAAPNILVWYLLLKSRIILFNIKSRYPAAAINDFIIYYNKW